MLAGWKLFTKYYTRYVERPNTQVYKYKIFR